MHVSNPFPSQTTFHVEIAPLVPEQLFFIFCLAYYDEQRYDMVTSDGASTPLVVQVATLFAQGRIA